MKGSSMLRLINWVGSVYASAVFQSVPDKPKVTVSVDVFGGKAYVVVDAVKLPVPAGGTRLEPAIKGPSPVGIVDMPKVSLLFRVVNAD